MRYIVVFALAVSVLAILYRQLAQNVVISSVMLRLRICRGRNLRDNLGGPNDGGLWRFYCYNLACSRGMQIAIEYRAY